MQMIQSRLQEGHDFLEIVCKGVSMCMYARMHTHLQVFQQWIHIFHQILPQIQKKMVKKH